MSDIDIFSNKFDWHKIASYLESEVIKLISGKNTELFKKKEISIIKNSTMGEVVDYYDMPLSFELINEDDTRYFTRLIDYYDNTEVWLSVPVNDVEKSWEIDIEDSKNLKSYIVTSKIDLNDFLKHK